MALNAIAMLLTASSPASDMPCCGSRLGRAPVAARTTGKPATDPVWPDSETDKAERYAGYGVGGFLSARGLLPVEVVSLHVHTLLSGYDNARICRRIACERPVMPPSGGPSGRRGSSIYSYTESDRPAACGHREPAPQQTREIGRAELSWWRRR